MQPSKLAFPLLISVTISQLGSYAFAQAPSFDCSKSSTSDEIAICRDAELAQLDVSYANLFETARNTSNHDQAVKIARQSLRLRRSCGGDHECIKSVFLSAIHELTPLTRDYSPPLEDSANPIGATKWSVSAQAVCYADSQSYEIFAPKKYTLSLNSKISVLSGENVTNYDYDAKSRRFVMNMYTTTNLSRHPWNKSEYEGILLPDGRLQLHHTFYQLRLEAMNAVSPSYDIKKDTSIRVPCTSARVAEDYSSAKAPMIFFVDDGFVDDQSSSCEEVFSSQVAKTKAMAVTSFFRSDNEWRLEFVPSAACLADKAQIDLGLCDIQTDAIGKFVQTDEGLELNFTIGTCDNSVLLDGAAGAVNATSRYGSGCKGRTDNEHQKIYICKGALD